MAELRARWDSAGSAGNEFCRLACADDLELQRFAARIPSRRPRLRAGRRSELAPKPRTSPAVTTADPVLTRFALGRSNDGSQFGMFLQVFADGTVVDSEGVHHIRATDLRPIVDMVQSGELFRVRGHCGAPSTDFIEYVHVVIYERRLGRLNAHSFSYSGNGQGAISRPDNCMRPWKTFRPSSAASPV